MTSTGTGQRSPDRAIERAASSQAGEIVCRMDALVGANGNGMRNLAQECVLAGGKRLLDEDGAVVGGRQHVFADIVLGPGLVGIDDEMGIGGGGSDRVQALDVILAAHLDLDDMAMGGGAGTVGHVFRVAKRNGIGRFDGARREPAGAPVCRNAGHLGFQIPQGAIHGVAGCAGPHGGHQAGAVETAADGIGDGRDLVHHALDGLAIASIGHAFGPAGRAGFLDMDGDHVRIGLRSAGNGERSGNRKTLLCDGKSTRHGFLSSRCPTCAHAK